MKYCSENVTQMRIHEITSIIRYSTLNDSESYRKTSSHQKPPVCAEAQSPNISWSILTNLREASPSARGRGEVLPSPPSPRSRTGFVEYVQRRQSRTISPTELCRGHKYRPSGHTDRPVGGLLVPCRLENPHCCRRCFWPPWWVLRLLFWWCTNLV